MAGLLMITLPTNSGLGSFLQDKLTIMKSQFDTLLEGQKKAFDLWTESSKKVMDQFSGSVGAPSKEDFLGDWFKSQKKLWEEAMKTANLKDTFEQSPEKLQEWAKLQTDFAQKWMNFYAENAKQFGMKAPSINGYSTSAFTDHMPKDWSQMMDQTNKWIRANILDKLPHPQGFHYENFNELYDAMHRYWGPMQQMMQHGITDWKGIELFFKPADYQEIVGKFMGFKPVTDLSAMLEQFNHSFEQMSEWMQQYMAQPEDWKKQWEEMIETGNKFGNPVFNTVLNLNSSLREGLESLYNVAGQNKEVEMAKLLKDIQFTYIAFILKTVDMQSKVYQASQYALPDTIQSFYEKYQTDKDMPDYQGFFTEFVNVLEQYMIDVLESKEYSILQSEVAKAGITVKSKMDELVELAFSDLPFLMQSHVDDVAVETRALRKKVRTLEGRLAALEAKLEGASSAKPVVESNDPQTALLQAIGRASAAQKDDLKRIKGIGPKLEDMLNSIGVYSFRQISKMTEAQYQLVDELISAFQGRAQRDKWADQATKLL
jgi:predicted flap endonuclease-1-like 5' DNA nuclease